MLRSLLTVFTFLLFSSASVHALPQPGLVSNPEISAWEKDFSVLLKLQADAYSDSGWPAYFNRYVRLEVALIDQTVTCNGAKAYGCLLVNGCKRLGQQTVCEFTALIPRVKSLADSDIPEALGEIYLYTHPKLGMDKDEFWGMTHGATIRLLNLEEPVPATLPTP